MLAKLNYEEDETIYEKLEKTKDNSKFKYILVMFFIAFVFLSYFIARFFVNTESINQNHEDIQNIKMIAESLNLMKKVKLYGIEAVIDNSKFKNYTLLSDILTTHVTDLYEHQRRYNTYIYPAAANLAVIFNNDKISTLIKESLCLRDYIELYLTSNVGTSIFPKSSYSVSECEVI